MTILRNGGTAVDAVEVTIMVLENAPITNAGFGSNLNEKGIVECDASIVDHFGRSGAAGAVPSKCAKQGSADPGRAKANSQIDVKNPIQLARRIYEKAYRSPGMSRVPPNLICGQGATDFAWNNNVILVTDDALVSPNARQRWQTWCNEIAEYQREHPTCGDQSDQAWHRRPPTPLATRINRLFPEVQEKMDVARTIAGDSPEEDTTSVQDIDGRIDDDDSQVDSSATASNFSGSARPRSRVSTSPQRKVEDDDEITDTVGAIAVDKYGNIAAGSSSGGIGMKHQGRIGPAALIGIGTHVMPVDPTDEDRTSVAVVTSGTGEHIASTLSASTCATRLFYSQRMGEAGVFEEVTEEEAMQGMIVNEFSGMLLLCTRKYDTNGIQATQPLRTAKSLVRLASWLSNDQKMGSASTLPTIPNHSLATLSLTDDIIC